MRPHGESENGVNLDDGQIPHNQLSLVLNDAVAGFAHLYAYGDSKCTLISQLLGRPVHNLEDYNCPSLRFFRPNFCCTKPCHRNPSFRCATRRIFPLRVANVPPPENVMLPALMTRRVILPDLFQRYKAAQICHFHSFYDGITTTSYSQRALHLGGPAFYPSRVLLCRVFFLIDDKSRYVSVGFYPAHNSSHWSSLLGLVFYRSFYLPTMSTLVE